MDMVEDFLRDYTIEERATLFIESSDLLKSLNYVDHINLMHQQVELTDYLEIVSIISNIETILIKSFKNVLLEHFVVVRDGYTLKDYISLLNFIIYLGDSLESETILDRRNDELTAKDQLLDWVEVFENQSYELFSNMIEHVTDNLIDNIEDIHELSCDVEAVEVDELFEKKITYLKSFENEIKDMLTVKPDSLVMSKIRNNTIRSCLTLDDLYNEYRDELLALKYITQNTDVYIYQLLGFIIMTTEDIAKLQYTTMEFINRLYSDIAICNELQTSLNHLLNNKGLSCKILNTI